MPTSEPAKTSQPSKNALSHGFYTGDLVLASENPDEFNALHQALREEYCPDGTSEEETVLNLAILYWKRRRLARRSKLAYKREADALADASSDGLKGVTDSMREAVKLKYRASQYTYSGICKKLEQLYTPDQSSAESKQSTIDELEKLAALMKEMNILGGMVPTLDLTGPDRDYQDEIMEKDLKIHTIIDRGIEKALQQLARAKEYKKFYGIKSTNAKQIELTSLPKLPEQSDKS